MSDISRHHFSLAVALTDTLSSTGVIDYGEMAGGIVYIPASSSITALTYHVSSTRDDGLATPVYVAAYDSDLAAVTHAVTAEKGYPIPEAIFGAVSVKIVTNADETVPISLKG